MTSLSDTDYSDIGYVEQIPYVNGGADWERAVSRRGLERKLSPEKVYYTPFETNIGRMYVASTVHGVCRILLPTEPEEEFFRWLTKIFNAENIIEDKRPNELLIEEITQYLRRELTIFSCSIDLRGTPFQRRVWARVREIPYGATATYREIAEKVERPGAMRAVGAANAANPIPVVIPCHRVVGVRGDLVGYGGGLELKRYLLLLEGAL